MKAFANEFTFGMGATESRMALITFSSTNKIDQDYEWAHEQTNAKIDSLFYGLSYATGKTATLEYVNKC